MLNKSGHDLSLDSVKAIAVGFGEKSNKIESIKTDLAELEELIYTLGWDLVGSTFQRVEQMKPRTLLGAGKLEELKSLIEETGATAIVIDHQLSGVQLRNLTKELDVIVADRNQVIIDIFAKRAQTKEGKLQVELARLLDELPRMIGGWHGSLSRLGGGIGTRGPGESALEHDRRTIRERISTVRKRLEEVKKHRNQTKKTRTGTLKLALVGYTNAGKSSLLEVLSGQSTYVEDQLFATLDPLTKKVFIKDMGEIVVTDTVGFIKKIPTHLIEAFKATLEQSEDADILLHVIDCSDPNHEERAAFVEDLISSFDWGDKEILSVYNKIDLLKPEKRQMFKRQNPFALISTYTGEGISQLKHKIKDLRPSNLIQTQVFIPNTESLLSERLKTVCQIERAETSSVGTVFYVLIQEKYLKDWKDYIQ
ncbi:MAG: GTPase HflX [Bdellovibrionales bacterium]